MADGGARGGRALWTAEKPKEPTLFLKPTTSYLEEGGGPIILPADVGEVIFGCHEGSTALPSETGAGGALGRLRDPAARADHTAASRATPRPLTPREPCLRRSTMS